MSSSPPDEVVIGDVTVRKSRRRSGPVWSWRIEKARDVILHSEIMWVEETRKWLRGTSVTDPIGDGGWDHYPVHYRRAFDETDAWKEVYRVLTKELEGEPRDWDGGS